ELWQDVARLGWFPSNGMPTLVQIAQHCRSAIALETARSLIAVLTGRPGSGWIQILDPGASADEWYPIPLRHVRSEQRVNLSGVAASRGLSVPALWFEECFIVTIGSPVPSAVGRVSGVLEAQAEVLAQVGNTGHPKILVYEAHRLA